ncbi:protein phosphatase 1 regulatory subunit 42 [Thermostichus vulcanus]|uniref:Leucine-rich repeat domain-containing protein n=1 Tax=Thermostichus vulcanus str. 'Rupite' TaxID=2813851 RepID=A0ABT0CAU7_THEVL|nr:protein phosphatase 1 regulatory subunit 42 [Thermostichus vulcanus]MCJ2542470.1 leucine-rich repeat domain-containing protein [Thermostichus vulcanus str. 'Rupite']
MNLALKRMILNVHRSKCPPPPLTDGMDPGLSAAIRTSIGKPAGEITESDLASITELDASYRQISTLEGMPTMPNLRILDLEGNKLTSIEGLPNLPELQRLFLAYNELTDLRGYPNLPKLQELDLGANSISTLAGLNASNATDFRVNLNCAVGSNGIDLLELPTNLTELYLGFSAYRAGDLYRSLTQIPNMPSSLPNLRVLILNHNSFPNLEGLSVDLSSLQILDVSRNPLTSLSGLPPVSALPNLRADL